jgi:plasmid stabilization system protein ParE
MPFKTLVSQEAQLDLKEYYLYYKQVAGKKIADAFFDDFDGMRKTISKNPYFQIWFDEFRAVPLKKYPFLIFFSIDEEEKTIIIARIFHTAQNPEKYP